LAASTMPGNPICSSHEGAPQRCWMVINDVARPIGRSAHSHLKPNKADPLPLLQGAGSAFYRTSAGFQQPSTCPARITRVRTATSTLPTSIIRSPSVRYRVTLNWLSRPSALLYSRCLRTVFAALGSVSCTGRLASERLIQERPSASW